MKAEIEDSSSKRHRSPNYPAVGLREAVERLRNLYAKDGKAGAPAQLAAVHIGFGKAHGQAMSVLAALKKFGLIVESSGRFVPTQRGLEIVNLPNDDARRQKAIQEAVLEPSIYRELIEKHRESGWPADDVLASELVTYKNFNPKSANGFVVDLKDSLDFSGLSQEVALESDQEVDSEMIEEAQTQPNRIVNLSGSSAGKSTVIGKASETISLPVGISESGEIVFAHVRFDSGIKRNLVASLRGLLEVMEKTLP